jgi:glutamate 5-kinase
MLTPQQQAAANLQQRQTLIDAGVLDSSGNFTKTPSVRAMQKLPSIGRVVGFVSRKAKKIVSDSGNAVGQAIGKPFSRFNKVIKVDNSQRSRKAAAGK